MSEEIQSEEVKAAKGAEIRKKVSERISNWVKEKSRGIEQVDRHAFNAVKKKAVTGESPQGAANRLKSAIESGGGVVKDEAKKTKNKMLMKTLGIIASVGAFIDPEPVSKAALAATATGIGVAEKATELKAMKDARDIKKSKGLAPQDAKGAIVERMLQVGNPSY